MAGRQRDRRDLQDIPVRFSRAKYQRESGHTLYSQLGTPDEDEWPGVTDLPDFNRSFPKWEKQSWKKACPRLNREGLELIGKMFELDPAKRISAREALKHPYFDDLETFPH